MGTSESVAQTSAPATTQPIVTSAAVPTVDAVQASIEALASSWARMVNSIGFDGDRSTTDLTLDVEALAGDASLDGRVRGTLAGPGRIELRLAMLDGIKVEPGSNPPVDLVFMMFEVAIVDGDVARDVIISIGLLDTGRPDSVDLIAQAERLAAEVPAGASVVVLLDSYEPLAGLDDTMSIRMMAVESTDGVSAINPTRPTGLQPLDVASLDELWELVGRT
jgi:hypothetical protein